MNCEYLCHVNRSMYVIISAVSIQNQTCNFYIILSLSLNLFLSQYSFYAIIFVRSSLFIQGFSVQVLSYLTILFMIKIGYLFLVFVFFFPLSLYTTYISLSLSLSVLFSFTRFYPSEYYFRFYTSFLPIKASVCAQCHYSLQLKMFHQQQSPSILFLVFRFRIAFVFRFIIIIILG